MLGQDIIQAIENRFSVKYIGEQSLDSGLVKDNEVYQTFTTERSHSENIHSQIKQYLLNYYLIETATLKIIYQPTRDFSFITFDFHIQVTEETMVISSWTKKGA